MMKSYIGGQVFGKYAFYKTLAYHKLTIFRIDMKLNNDWNKILFYFNYTTRF